MKTRILSTVLALIMILGAFALASCGKKGFDYAKEDLSSYISFKNPDYKKLPIELETNVTDYTVITEISDRFKELEKEDGSIFTSDRAIAENDLVKVYYRGATVDEDGKETDFQGGSNLGHGESAYLWIGSDSFIEGFEDSMIGIVPSETSLTAREDGTVGEEDLVVLDITGTYGEGSTYVSYKDIALKLSETSLLEDSVKAELVGKNVGEKLIFSLELNADTDAELETVIFAATVKKVITMDAKKLELTFPKDYSSTELAGKKVNFYVVVEGVASINEDTISKLGFESDEEDLISAYKEFVAVELCREYAKTQAEKADTFKNLVRNAIWAAILDNTEVASYPAGTIESYIKTEKNNLEYEYNASPDAQSIQSQYSTLEAYAKNKYGEEDYESVIEENAKAFVKGKLTLYSIAKEMGLTEVTKNDKKELKAELEVEYTEYYKQLYSLYNSIFGYGYSESDLKVLSESNAKATVDGLSESYLNEAVIKNKILDAIYADYNTDFDTGLITWTSQLDAEEAESEE